MFGYYGFEEEEETKEEKEKKAYVPPIPCIKIWDLSPQIDSPLGFNSLGIKHRLEIFKQELSPEVYQLDLKIENKLRERS